MVEVGDIIKFAELAWVVVDYGWSPDLNASKCSAAMRQAGMRQVSAREGSNPPFQLLKPID